MHSYGEDHESEFDADCFFKESRKSICNVVRINKVTHFMKKLLPFLLGKSLTYMFSFQLVQLVI